MSNPEWYCPIKGCSADLTGLAKDLAKDPKNYPNQQLWDGKLFCPSCYNYVRPTANKELYWEQAPA